MGSESDSSGSRVFSEEEVEEEFGEAFDQSKESLGQSDDDGDDDQPWRFVVGWSLRRGDTFVPLPLDLSVEGCILEGWLLPRQTETRPVRVSLKNISFVAFDRERQTRGWWVQSEPRRRKSQGAFYWLQEAAEPDLHVQSRAVLALVSATLDVVSVNERAPTEPVTVALGDWFATMMERGVDARSVLARFQNEVYTHVVRARPKLTPSCAFLKTLTSLKKQKQRKVVQDVAQFCTVAEEVSGRFPWGGELQMKRITELPNCACRNWVGTPKGQLRINEIDDDAEEEFEMPKVSTVHDSPTSKPAKRRKATACRSSSSSSASGDKGVKEAQEANRKAMKKTDLVRGLDIDSSDISVDLVKKPHKGAGDAGMSTRRPSQTSTASTDRLNNAITKAKLADSKPPMIQHATASSSISLNSRVEVFWPLEKRYYSGVVDKIGKKRFRVHYDDDDEGWVGFDEDYRSLEIPTRTPKPQSSSKARVAEREFRNLFPPPSELNDSRRLESKSDVSAVPAEAGVLKGRRDDSTPSLKVSERKTQANSGKKRKVASSGPEDQGASIATAKKKRKEGVGETGGPPSPARESDGAASVVHFQGEPIVEKEISPRLRDTQGKLTKKPSQRRALSNLGGPLSEKTKVVGGVDQTGSNPIPRSQECPSSEMGDPSPRKLKITKSSSLPSQEKTKILAKKNDDIVLDGEFKDGSHSRSESISSQGEATAKRSESRISKSSPEIDLVTRDISPNGGQNTGHATKRHPTLLRIQLKKALKSIPRNWVPGESPPPNPSACHASSGRDSPDAFRPLVQARADKDTTSPMPRANASGTTNSPAQTRTDLDTSYTASASQQRKTDGITPDNPKASEKTSGASKSLSQRTDGIELQSVPKRDERSDSTKALPQTRADVGKPKVMLDADALHAIRRMEHDMGSGDVEPNSMSLGQGRAEVDNSGTAKSVTSLKHALSVINRDPSGKSPLQMASAPEPSLTEITHFQGLKEAQRKEPCDSTKREQSPLDAKSLATKKGEAIDEVRRVAEPQVARGIQRNCLPSCPVGPKVGNSVHIPRKAPRRSSLRFKELVNKARVNSFPLPSADFSDDDEFPDTSFDRHPIRLSQARSNSAVVRSKPETADAVSGVSAHDAAVESFDEALVHCPESRKPHGKGHVAGILRNSMYIQPNPDSQWNEDVSDQNAVHAAHSRQVPIDRIAAESVREKPLPGHRIGEVGVAGSTTVSTMPRMSSTLSDMAVIATSSQPPNRREIIHESDSHTEETTVKPTDQGPPRFSFLSTTNMKSTKNDPNPSDRGSHARSPTPPRVNQEPHRTQERATLHSESQSPHGGSLLLRNSYTGGRNPVPVNEKIGEGPERIRDPSRAGVAARAGAEGRSAQREHVGFRALTGSSHQERPADESFTARQDHPHESRREWTQAHQRRSFRDVDRSWTDANRPRPGERDRRVASSSNFFPEGRYQPWNGNTAQARNVPRGMGFERWKSDRAPGRTFYR